MMIDPVAFSLFGVDIYWYGFAYAFTFLFGEYFVKQIIKKYKLNIKHFEKLSVYVVLGILLGGRIGCFLFYEKTIFTWELFLFRNGGMSFHGGLLGSIIGALIFAIRYKQNFLIITDLIALTAPIGLFLGRVANYINDEIPGKILFGKVQPVVLYEALSEGLILFILLNMQYKKNFKKPGKTSALFLIYYAMFRFLLDIFKEAPITMFNLQTGQLLCIPMLVYGIVLYSKTEK